MTADSILGHQLNQLALVRIGMDAMVEEDILSLGYKDISIEWHNLPIENGCP